MSSVRYKSNKNSHQEGWQRRDGKSPDLRINYKQLQTANLVYIFDEIILSVTEAFPGSKVACDTLSRPGIYVYQIHVSSKYIVSQRV